MLNKIYNCDCMDLMPKIANGAINLTLTDIPYEDCNMSDNGLRTLSKGDANTLQFDLKVFLNEVYRITGGVVIIFCGKSQFSHIYDFFKEKKGTTRAIVWQKSNPSPINGKSVYLSGVEMAVYFKKPKSTFNAFCKNSVFKFPNGSSKIHPTEKNHALLKELISDNSNKGDLLFDPCFGSGSALLCAMELGRNYLGCEINKKYFDIAKERLGV